MKYISFQPCMPLLQTVCPSRGAIHDPPTSKHAAPKVPASHANPLARRETETLLNRMLSISLKEQDYQTAARIRDMKTSLQSSHPTHALRQALSGALAAQDFGAAARFRNEIERRGVLAHAERAKPRFPVGMVVWHGRIGARMLVFGVDYKCRAGVEAMDETGGCFVLRGGEQPWYHAAVDERDRKIGDNIVYVAEDDLIPADEGEFVEHPITRIMFKGVYGKQACPGFTCYVSGSRADGCADGCADDDVECDKE